MFQSLFDKVAGSQAYSFTKIGFLHTCFPVKFAKSLRTVAIFITDFTEEILCSSDLVQDVIQRSIYNPAKHLRCNFLRKQYASLENTVPDSLH